MTKKVFYNKHETVDPIIRETLAKRILKHIFIHGLTALLYSAKT